ncbi:XRE family transcriptional regulator [Ekhidna sp.]|uniref:XRE family transcriptional regulator n=1 Tax=Ekhidna sp. TaxID=2608089 RepID=UPI00329A7098
MILEDINPSMLTLARESRGISQSELSKKIGVSQGKLSKAEKGEQGLPDDAFVKLSKVLEYPPKFFYQKSPSAPVSHYYYRKRITIPQKTVMQVESVVKIFRQNIDSLTDAVELPEFRLPTFNPDIESPEVIAEKVRYILNISRGPVPNLVNLLETNGVIVVKTDLLSEKIDGISSVSDKGNRIIFLNERMPADRQRFSLAHELGHMLMHFDIPTITEDVEDEANRFASEFLMPRNEVINSLRALNFPKLGELKRYWKVSMKSLVYRAKMIKAIDDRQYRNLMINFSKKGMTKSEPIQLAEEKPFIIDRIIKMHLNDLAYSEKDLASIIHLLPDEFQNRFMTTERPKLRVLRNVG